MKSYKRIEALTKAAKILKFMSDEKEAVGGTRIAQGTGLPIGTAMCHLITMEELGWVVSIGDNWRLGMGLALIWARVKTSQEAEREQINKNIELLTAGGKNDQLDSPIS
jgi:DNA-binding IclR family transcriptional regulator